MFESISIIFYASSEITNGVEEHLLAVDSDNIKIENLYITDSKEVAG